MEEKKKKKKACPFVYIHIEFTKAVEGFIYNIIQIYLQLNLKKDYFKIYNLQKKVLKPFSFLHSVLIKIMSFKLYLV